MKSYKAFIFDLNGTMIDDMAYHIKAWHEIFNRLGAPLTMEETKLQCYGKNGEVLDRVFPDRFSDAEKDKMSIEKETAYQAAFRPHLKLIDGLDIFIEKAFRSNIKMAIGSAAIMYNVNFVLDGLQLHNYFDAIVSADDVKISKPDPETFLKCAEQLNVLPADCLVFEDSPKGSEAALRATMDCVAITTMHTAAEFDQSNIIRFINDYNGHLFEEIISG